MRRLFLRESFLVMVSLIMALAITIPPYAISVAKGGCVLFHLVENRIERIILLWVTVGFWESICFLYTTVVVIMVIHTLQNHSRVLTANTQNRNSRRGSVAVVDDDPSGVVKCRGRSSIQDQNNSSIRNRRESTCSNPMLVNHFERVARRIMFYPLIPLVTQSFYIIINTYFLYIGHRTLVLLYLFYLVPYSAGLLNALVFFIFDPAMPEIATELNAYLFGTPTFVPPGLPIAQDESRPAPVWSQESTDRLSRAPNSPWDRPPSNQYHQAPSFLTLPQPTFQK
ncbi:hypothetical protein DSO57_1021289 [Entomophthora muscae]|nr:hypothetical protein DSO57_1021289 [Entomophthora muscae]